MNPRSLAGVPLHLSSLILLCLAPYRSSAQESGRPSEAQLEEITERGRALAAYDQAAWHATDALQTANPRTAEGQLSLAHRESGGWRVVFGHLDPAKTRFLIAYEAAEGAKREAFRVTRNDPAREDTGFFLFAARALEMALADFGRPARPYSSAVLAAADSQLYVYLYPAPLKAGSYPFGGDVRYRISADGGKILEKRELHKTVMDPAPGKGRKTAAGFHTHLLGNLPEDTDVLHVLQQDPRIPETISTARFVYEVTADGAIRIRQEKRK